MGKPAIQSLAMPSFSASKTSNQNISQGSGSASKVTFTQEDWDDKGWFAGSTFTPTEAGRYSMNVVVHVDSANSTDWFVQLRVAGSVVRQNKGSRNGPNGLTALLNLGVGQTVEVWAYGEDGSGTIQGGVTWTYWQGIKVG